MSLTRIIGHFEGNQPGPLLIALGGVHGNEPAGIAAIETVIQLLEREQHTHTGFSFKGAVLGLRGNLQALSEGKRFIEKDLNRQWSNDNVKRVQATEATALHAEDRELRELIEVIEPAIHSASHLYFLDLHTTSAGGGIFTVATDDPESIRIGVGLHAPVIKGLLRGLEGTSLHYFTTQNTGIPTTGVSFESGQHDDPLSVNRAIAAMLNYLQIIGCIPEGSIENRYDELLRRYSEGLPKVANLVEVRRIQPNEAFRMQPGYHNFKSISKGELLAYSNGQAITAVADGLILMPLYQPQGSDGFFIVQAVEF